MALVLLRRILANSYEEFLQVLSKEEKEQFHTGLLNCIRTEDGPILKKRVTDVLAEAARNTISVFCWKLRFDLLLSRKFLDDETGKQEWTGNKEISKEQ
jgi:hypothetical protein